MRVGRMGTILLALRRFCDVGLPCHHRWEGAIDRTVSAPEPLPGTSVFLSYAHADRVFAQRLAARLQESGIQLWWDELLESGAGFADLIENRLNSVDAVLALWSPEAVRSDWVRD